MKTLPYQFDIGEYQGFVLYDYAHDHSAEELIVNPIPEELEQVTQDYAFQINQIPVGYNNLLLRIGDQNVLVDAGIRRPLGKLCEGLEALQIDPGDIDTIVITHADRDHIGGIFDQDGEISFPNARYIILADSWGYWSSKKGRAELTKLNKWTKDKAQFAWETYSKIKDMLLFVEPGEQFMPGLRLFPAMGHRYDHSILRVASQDEQIMHISDALAHPLFMGNVDWYSTYDANPAQAIETKNKLLNLCAAEHILVFGAHFPFPGLGHVKPGHECWKWGPIEAA